MITVMAAVARNGVIGRAGTIPWHLRADMVRFRQITMGHVLVMGRRTYESIGRPLPGRTTIVVTRRPAWSPDHQAPSLSTAPSVPAALDLAAGLDDETFVQGGTRVYAEALPRADRLLITWVDAEPDGDTFFPPVDWSQWREAEREQFDGGAWVTYLRRRPEAGSDDFRTSPA